MLEQALIRDQDEDKNYLLKPNRIVGDEEFIPFQNSSLDLVISIIYELTLGK